ncbi:CynX/NimT family MFS transporter [Chloroflexota bacterium]
MIKSENYLNGELNSHKVEPYQSWYCWVMLTLAWLLNFAFGTVQSSIAPLVTPILADLHISYSQMGVILGAWPLTYMMAAAIGGAIIDRWGIRTSLFLGTLIIGLSASLRYFANGFVGLFLCVALFGVGGPMISIGSPKIIATWFKGRGRSIAVGVYMTGSAIGRLLILSLTNSLVMPLSRGSWRLTFVIYGFLAFAVALAWRFLAKDIKPTRVAESASITNVFTNLIKIRNVRLILMIGFLSMVVGHGFTNWLPKLLETGGLSPEIAGFTASIPVLTGIPAVLLIPHLTPPHLRGRIAALLTMLGAIVLFIITMSSGGLLVTGLGLYGLFFRCTMPMLMLVLMDLPEVGSRYIGAAGGMYFCIAEIGGFVGPSVMGAIVDLTGNFLIGVSLMAGLSVVTGIMALLLRIQTSTTKTI